MRHFIFTAVFALMALQAHAEEISYSRHCSNADLYPSGMRCEENYSNGTKCEAFDRTITVGENSWAQKESSAPPKCIVSIRYKTNPPCVPDPAGNEPTCNYEARMAVARRHRFTDVSHAEMSQTIEASEKLTAERDGAYQRCMKKNNFCEYRDER
jgi:hypothetical protein